MFLIIGHGLAGALLADALLRRGCAVRVVDAEAGGGTSPASAVASGILNPVTGKRLTRAWNLEAFLPAALRTYRGLEGAFDATLVEELDVLWLHANPEEATLFATRAEQDAELFEAAVNPQPYESFLHLREAPGRIHPVYGVDVGGMLALLRGRLQSAGAIIEEPFRLEELQEADGGVSYHDVEASHAIFCEGAGAVGNPYFRNLPWSPAAGEAIILRIAELPRRAVYKLGHSLSLSPWPGGENEWWLGSNYLWDTLAPVPTGAFRMHAEGQLKAWLRLPYQIIDHRAGVRPATVDRKPFIGFHPLHPRIGILNGLGAKGVLMAPYLAENLAEHLTEGAPLMPEADVARHRRALSR